MLDHNSIIKLQSWVRISVSSIVGGRRKGMTRDCYWLLESRRCYSSLCSSVIPIRVGGVEAWRWIDLSSWHGVLMDRNNLGYFCPLSCGRAIKKGSQNFKSSRPINSLSDHQQNKIVLSDRTAHCPQTFIVVYKWIIETLGWINFYNSELSDEHKSSKSTLFAAIVYIRYALNPLKDGLGKQHFGVFG